MILAGDLKEMISKEEALRLIEKTGKYSHLLIASAIMHRLAERLGEDEKKWEIVGLLHDLDYDQTKDDMSKHGIITSEVLKGKLPEDCLYAIKCHDYRTGFKPRSKLDKALIIADSLAIIIGRTDDKIPSSKKLEAEIGRISASEPWLRENLMRCEEIGMRMCELLTLATELENDGLNEVMNDP